MSLGDVIDSLASDRDLVVTRRAAGAFDSNGVWVPGASTTLIIPAVSIQPATGMSRVVGGRDAHYSEEGEMVNDVRVIYTAVEMKTRSPTNEPDQVAYDGGTWTVIRAERQSLNDDITFRVLMTRETRGAS